MFIYHSRSGAARHLGKSCPGCQFHGRLPYRLRRRICPIVEAGVSHVRDSAMHRDNWRDYEQNGLTLHAVSQFASLHQWDLPHYVFRLSLKHVGESGSLAEEVISTIRTAQAFGTQKILASLYDEHIEQSEQLELKSALMNGAGTATFFFIIYTAYALGQHLVYCHAPGPCLTPSVLL